MKDAIEKINDKDNYSSVEFFSDLFKIMHTFNNIQEIFVGFFLCLINLNKEAAFYLKGQRIGMFAGKSPNLFYMFCKSHWLSHREWIFRTGDYYEVPDKR